jgi:hypothetical protein
MSETPRTDEVWDGSSDNPLDLRQLDGLFLIAEMLERTAIALEADSE